MPHFGKLTRLPFLKSEELHRRLLDDEPGRVILKWVNGDAECLKVLKAWYGGRKVTAGNLSDYKAGAKFQEWKKKREALEVERADTLFAVSVAQEAGLDLGDAGDAIFISDLMAMRRQAQGDPEQMEKVIKSYAGIRKLTVARGSLAVREKERESRERAGERVERRDEMNTVKNFMKWAASKEAQGILNNGKPKAVQMDLLHELMFGAKPEA